MQPWKISVGLTAILCAVGLMLAGQGFSWIATLLLDSPHRFLVSRLMVRRAGPGRADVFALLRCAAHGPCRHGPESGSDGAVHKTRGGRAA